MDGPAHDLRLASVQRFYAPTRLSADTLTSVYERVFQTHLVKEAVSESLGIERSVCESPILVLTGGQHE
jgi:hypothetical protein